MNIVKRVRSKRIKFPAQFGGYMECSPVLWGSKVSRKVLRDAVMEQAYRTFDYHKRVPVVGTWEVIEKPPHKVFVYGPPNYTEVIGERIVCTIAWKCWLV